MVAVVLFTLTALVLAGAVAVVAGGGLDGVRTFGAHLREGLRRDTDGATDGDDAGSDDAGPESSRDVTAMVPRQRSGLIATARRDHADAADAESGSLDDLFADDDSDGDAYVRPEEIFGGLARTTQRAVRGIAARR